MIFPHTLPVVKRLPCLLHIVILLASVETCDVEGAEKEGCVRVERTKDMGQIAFV